MSKELNANLPDKEEVLNDEMGLLQGLIEAGNYKEDEAYRKKLVIQRNGKKLFEFTVRPLSDDEFFECRKKSTKRLPNPAGRKLPPIDGETDISRFRSWKIYMATIDEDRAKIWDNKKMQEALNVLTNVDLISKVFMDSEKDWIIEEIDKLGVGITEDGTEESVSLEEYAKN